MALHCVDTTRLHGSEGSNIDITAARKICIAIKHCTKQVTITLFLKISISCVKKKKFVMFCE
jgi:acyl CoA:acetate/3-ketoacid CoA transferase beta subunit